MFHHVVFNRRCDLNYPPLLASSFHQGQLGNGLPRHRSREGPTECVERVSPEVHRAVLDRSTQLVVLLFGPFQESGDPEQIKAALEEAKRAGADEAVQCLETAD